MLLKDELINRYDYSSRLIREIKRNGCMKVNGESVWVNEKLKRMTGLKLSCRLKKLMGFRHQAQS